MASYQYVYVMKDLTKAYPGARCSRASRSVSCPA
jgi:hypothetical protein